MAELIIVALVMAIMVAMSLVPKRMSLSESPLEGQDLDLGLHRLPSSSRSNCPSRASIVKFDRLPRVLSVIYTLGICKMRT